MTATPQAAALQARRDLSLGAEGPVPDILQLLEQGAGLNIVVAQLGDGPDGAYTVQRAVPFILVNSSRIVVRQRFTLAHEFGHHYMGHGDVLDVQVRWDATDPVEIAANQFAAEFLMPIGALNLWFETRRPAEVNLSTLVRLAGAYGVSCEMALWRVRAAERLSQLEAERMKERIDAHEHWGMRSLLGLAETVDTLTYVQDSPVRVPARMTDDVLRALDAGIIDAGLAAERLRVSEEQLSDLVERRAQEDE